MAASPSSKSAAYEQGVREGSAMAKKKAGKRSMEMEPGEGKVHEAAESPAEEAAEGPEPDDAPRARRRSRPTPSRQRSAKNAANTKAPMDSSCGGKKSMDGEGSCSCRAKKGAQCSCDGEGCGSSMKRRRSDALTAPEYLAACELGIQDRPRSYIRARLDAAKRLDLKCGKGSISPGEKCTKGSSAPAATQKPSSRISRKTKIGTTMALTGVVGNLAATGYTAGAAFTGNYKEVGRGLQAAAAFEGLTGAGFQTMGQKALAKEQYKGALISGTAGTFLSGDVIRAASFGKQAGKKAGVSLGNMKGRVRMAMINRRPMPKPKIKNGKIQDPWTDSMYADGFAVDYSQFEI